jgi:ATP-dependent protease ClpP protease subunit
MQLPEETQRQPVDFQYKAVISDKVDSTSLVRVADNRVYFYSEITSSACMELIQALREVDKKLRTEYVGRGIEKGPVIPIWLHIHSYGGELFAGLGTADQLAMIESPVYAVVEGVGASAATLIAMACTKTYISPSNFMLIHQLWSVAWGTHEEFKDEMNVQKRLMEHLVTFYAKHSKLKKKKIRKMLKRDFWMDAKLCVEFGFADEILK